MMRRAIMCVPGIWHPILACRPGSRRSLPTPLGDSYAVRREDYWLNALLLDREQFAARSSPNFVVVRSDYRPVCGNK